MYQSFFVAGSPGIKRCIQMPVRKANREISQRGPLPVAVQFLAIQVRIKFCDESENTHTHTHTGRLSDMCLI